MSLGYHISVHLLLPYNQKNIELFLQRGVRNLGFIYFKIDYTNLDALGSVINTSQALELINKGYPDEIMHCVIAKHLNSHFFLHFINDSNNITIMFSGFFNPATKTDNYTQEEDINISMYMRLMLDLVDEYRIMQLNVEKN